MNIFIEIIGYLAGICTAVCFLPQTIKTIKSKDVQGISFLSYSIYTLGLFLWCSYGYFIDSLPMIIFNIIGFTFAFIILVMIIKYKSQH